MSLSPDSRAHIVIVWGVAGIVATTIHLCGLWQLAASMSLLVWAFVVTRSIASLRESCAELRQRGPVQTQINVASASRLDIHRSQLDAIAQAQALTTDVLLQVERRLAVLEGKRWLDSDGCVREPGA